MALETSGFGRCRTILPSYPSVLESQHLKNVEHFSFRFGFGVGPNSAAPRVQAHLMCQENQEIEADHMVHIPDKHEVAVENYID
jgi:hypothetical protein